MPIRLDTELLKSKTLQLLGEVGIKVEHEELAAIMLAKGCTEAPTGRIRIPAELIAEFVAYQEPSRAQDKLDQGLVPICGPDWTHWLQWTGEAGSIRERLARRFQMQAFDCGPTQIFDYRTSKFLPVDTDVFVTMMKLAEATPEVGYVSTWYRQDVPQATERLASLILGMQYTSKVDGIEAIDPPMIKYLVGVGEIMTGEPGCGRYLAGSECLISPLILDHRASEDMLERNRLGVKRFHAASMPTIGISTPVTVASAILIGAAEILGCLAASYCLCPDADLTGRMISTVMDMRTADAASGGPENIQVILGVQRLFDDHFGGHLWAETYFSPSTNRPGLQAVYQNFFGAYGFGRMTGDPAINYPGMGTLDNGGVGSPTQFMLDLEIRRSQWALKNEVEVSEDTLLFDEVCKHVDTEQTFLTHDHTLEHFRDLWRSDIFPLTVPEEMAAGGDERRILDRCDEMWRANVEKWEAPAVDEGKMRELQALLRKAKAEFGVG